MALIALLRGELLGHLAGPVAGRRTQPFRTQRLACRKDAFAERIDALSSHAAPLYPVVPGRLVAINGEPVRQLVSKSPRANARFVAISA